MIKEKLTKRIQNYAQKELGIQRNTHWILAVSGGPDSMLLLDVFGELRSKLKLSLTVVYVNHGLRKEAIEEQHFVEKQSRLRGIPFLSFQRDVRSLRKSKQSLEECARIVRYECLEQAQKDLNADGILVAHHQNDVAETVLLHLIRGSGLNGLRGIRPVRGNIFRPLLCVSREEIMDYMSEECIPYCIDQSNEDWYYTRNRIRGLLLPLLQEQFNVQIVPILNRLSNLAEEDEKALQIWTDQVYDKVFREETNERFVLHIPMLLKCPLGIQRRVVKKTLSGLCGENGWTARDVSAVLDLTSKMGSSHEIHLKKDVICRKVYQELYFYTKEWRQIPDFCVSVVFPGNIKLAENGREYQMQVVKKEDITEDMPGLRFDIQKLPEKLKLRKRRPGDRFCPAGHQTKKKLKEWMIDHKIPVEERERIALLSGEDGCIFGVCGLEVSEQAAVTEDTKEILLLEERKNEKIL